MTDAERIAKLAVDSYNLGVSRGKLMAYETVLHEVAGLDQEAYKWLCAKREETKAEVDTLATLLVQGSAL